LAGSRTARAHKTLSQSNDKRRRVARRISKRRNIAHRAHRQQATGACETGVRVWQTAADDMAVNPMTRNGGVWRARRHNA